VQAGQAWALQGEFEAAEAVLSRAGEAAAAAAPLALERRGRALLHQDAAAALSSLQLERVRVAVRLKQQVGAGCAMCCGSSAPILARNHWLTAPPHSTHTDTHTNPHKQSNATLTC
jgi:hypothetical protein